MENNNYIISSITEEDVPAIINGKLFEIKQLQQRIDLSKNKSLKTKDKAEEINAKKTHLLNVVKQNRDTKETMCEIANAVYENTLIEEQLFGYQQKIVEMVKYVYGLGISNLAMTRAIIKELEKKLSGEEGETMDETVKAEIKNLICQLKDHQDLMQRHEMMKQKISEVDDKVELTKTEFHNETQNIKADIEGRIAVFDDKIHSYGDRLNTCIRVLNEYTGKVREIDELPKLDHYLNEIKQLRETLVKEREKSSKFAKVTLVMSIIAVTLAIFTFFIVLLLLLAMTGQLPPISL